MKVILFTLLFTTFSIAANANVCKPQFNDNSNNDPMAEKAIEAQNILKTADPTTYGFKLHGQALSVGDVVEIQLTKPDFIREVFYAKREFITTKEELQVELDNRSVEGVIAGSKIMMGIESKKPEVFLFIYDEKTELVYTISEQMIDVSGYSKITAKRYLQEKFDPVNSIVSEESSLFYQENNRKVH